MQNTATVKNIRGAHLQLGDEVLDRQREHLRRGLQLAVVGTKRVLGGVPFVEELDEGGERDEGATRENREARTREVCRFSPAWMDTAGGTLQYAPPARSCYGWEPAIETLRIEEVNYARAIQKALK